jgi:hypothetical protein
MASPKPDDRDHLQNGSPQTWLHLLLSKPALQFGKPHLIASGDLVVGDVMEVSDEQAELDPGVLGEGDPAGEARHPINVVKVVTSRLTGELSPSIFTGLRDERRLPHRDSRLTSAAGYRGQKSAPGRPGLLPPDRCVSSRMSTIFIGLFSLG